MLVRLQRRLSFRSPFLVSHQQGGPFARMRTSLCLCPIVEYLMLGGDDLLTKVFLPVHHQHHHQTTSYCQFRYYCSHRSGSRLGSAFGPMADVSHCKFTPACYRCCPYLGTYNHSSDLLTYCTSSTKIEDCATGSPAAYIVYLIKRLSLETRTRTQGGTFGFGFVFAS